MHIGLLFSPEIVAFSITPRNNFLAEGSAEVKESWDPTVDPDEVIQVLKRVTDCREAIWFYRLDPEAYVYEKYGQAFAHLVDGADFHNANIPPDHKFVFWAVEEVQKDIKEGKRVGLLGWGLDIKNLESAPGVL
ncbi:hypothetical protein NHQ30_003119 [Ciborinia camelliae]|nr:hypothetical protein NHQ30_003119 [Ciborinia camelliae]